MPQKFLFCLPLAVCYWFLCVVYTLAMFTDVYAIIIGYSYCYLTVVVNFFIVGFYTVGICYSCKGDDDNITYKKDLAKYYPYAVVINVLAMIAEGIYMAVNDSQGPRRDVITISVVAVCYGLSAVYFTFCLRSYVQEISDRIEAK